MDRRTKVETLSSRRLGLREIATVRVIAGQISETTGTLTLISDTRQDEWLAARLTGSAFGPPADEQEQRWNRGERVMLFRPLDALRSILPGEVFTSFSEGR